jgi:hypothetical protein
VPWPPSDTAEFRGARFADCDMSGAEFREVDLTGVRMRGVMMVDADIDGLVRNLVVNGVDVAPLVEAELDRRHPERLLLRSADPDELRRGWAVLESMWKATTDRIEALPEADRQRRIEDEWSAVETLRHLVFATDAWYGRAIAGEELPYHTIGLAPHFMDHQDAMGLDADAAPAFSEVLAVRQSRQRMVRRFLETATAGALQAIAPQVEAAGWPRPDPRRTVLKALHVILDEEWAHHGFCRRDLDELARPRA